MEMFLNMEIKTKDKGIHNEHLRDLKLKVFFLMSHNFQYAY